MRLRIFFVVVLVFVLPLLAVSARADELGPALVPFAVLGGTKVTNASGGGVGVATVITGSLGVWPGTSCTGFGPCDGGPGIIVAGTANVNNGAAMAASGALTAAMGTLNGLGTTGTIAAGGLNGLTLGPGVYNVTSAAFDLSGSTLTLTGDGMIVFRMSSTLTLGSGVTIDTSALGPDASLYWVAPSTGDAVTLGPNADAQGNFLAQGSIIFDPGATVGCGRVLSHTAVTFAGVGTTAEPGEGAPDPNQVGGGCTGNLANSGGLNGGGPGPGPVPEPGTLALLSSGLLLGMVFLTFRKSRVSSPSLSC
jgi:hypothetical protein